MFLAVELAVEFTFMCYADDNLKWCSYSVRAKVSSRLDFLKVLKRCSLSAYDLLYFYISAVRSIREYVCPAWYTSLKNKTVK